MVCNTLSVQDKMNEQNAGKKWRDYFWLQTWKWSSLRKQANQQQQLLPASHQRAMVRFQAIPCAICGGQSKLKQGFLWVHRTSPFTVIPPLLRTHTSLIPVIIIIIIIIIITIIIIISFMQGIHTYIPETNHVSRVYSVAAILRVLLMVHITLSSILNSFVLLH
jgi:hypothetical protein